MGNAKDTSETVHPLLKENIETLKKRREKQDRELTVQERAARAVATVAGSLPFIYAHLAVLCFWLIGNSERFAFNTPWDPHYTGLAAIASIEALFLSLFILVNQNRMTTITARNADLDLHVSLLAEHEVTRLMTICAAIAQKLGVRTEIDDQIEGLKEDVPAEAVLDKIDDVEKQGSASRPRQT